jgi:hypothetical protein
MVQGSAIQEEMMTTGTTLSQTAFLVLFVLGSLSAQEVTARNAFWSSSDLIKVTPNPASPKVADSNSTDLVKVTPKPEVHKPADSNRHTQKPAGEQPDFRSNPGQLVSQNGYGAAPQVVRTAKPRLGLRCSLLLRGLDNRYIEVSSNSIFQSGDHIRLGLLANEPGYIYVIQQGSTGAWSPVFPPPGSAPAANKIEAGELHMVPDGTHAFAFDKTLGDEKIYVILSRTPIGDIDHAIRGLQSDRKIQPPPTPDSANDVRVAERNIPNAFVQQLVSRDLTLVDEQTVNESNNDTNAGEKATYVVSKANAPDSSSEVVLRLDLRHQ